MATEVHPYMYDGMPKGPTIEHWIFQAERDFEVQVVLAYPHEVRFNRIENFDTLEANIQAVQDFLTRFPKSQYIAFPNSAIGRYKECAVSSVFFKNLNHALQTKLAFFG